MSSMLQNRTASADSIPGWRWPPSGAVADFLGDLTGRIGTRWADGEINVFDEHIASARLAQALSAISSSFGVPEDAPLWSLVALADERHTLGLAPLQLCLRSANIDALCIGADFPAAELLQHIRDADPDIYGLALSASSWSNDAPSLVKSYRDIASECRARGLELILGGRGAWPDVVDYGYRCHSFKELEQILSKMDLPA